MHFIIKSDLSTQHALSGISAIVKNVAGHFNHSIAARSNFEKVQLHVTESKKLIIRVINLKMEH